MRRLHRVYISWSWQARWLLKPAWSHIAHALAACLTHVKTVRERRELRCLNNTRSEINLHPIILLNKEAIIIKKIFMQTTFTYDSLKQIQLQTSFTHVRSKLHKIAMFLTTREKI
jgi:hypothetical protein